MFTGEYYHSIDAKGRVIVPSKFRELLGDGFTITVGFDGCLSMYSSDEWDKYVSKLADQNEFSELNIDARELRRFILSKAVTCELDKQGRVLIPAKLRARAGLEKEIVFVGLYSKIEIWDKDKWEENDVFEMNEVAERLSAHGIKL